MKRVFLIIGLVLTLSATAFGDADIKRLAGNASTVNGSTLPASKTVVGTNSSGQIIDATNVPYYASPLISKGPAAITSFAGTISRATTTLTFSNQNDANAAGYSATNPILGAIIIHPTGPVTMYITAWLSSLTATVLDGTVGGTLAAQTPTSVQLPIATFVNSAGVGTEVINAAGNVNIGMVAAPPSKLSVASAISTLSSYGSLFVNNSYNVASNPTVSYPLLTLTRDGNPGFTYNPTLQIGLSRYSTAGTGSNSQVDFMLTQGAFIYADTTVLSLRGDGNIGLNTTAFATSAAKVLAMGSGTMPTTAPAAAVQVVAQNYNGTASDARWHFLGESGVAGKAVLGSGTVSIKGAAASGGGYTRQLSEATTGALSGATGSIAVNVPTGSRLLGVQLRVDTLITTGDTATSWGAVYVNTPTTAICATQTFAKSTLFKALHPAYEITTGIVTITIAAVGGTFSGGVIRGIVYYEALDNMLAAP